MPSGKHLLLAACRASETAKEPGRSRTGSTPSGSDRTTARPFTWRRIRWAAWSCVGSSSARAEIRSFSASVTLGTPHAGSPWPTIQVGPRPRSRSGYGEVASADGLRFVVPVRTIHSGPNPRYFGRERGVTWYNLASDQYTGLNAITVPGTLRDSLNLLAVVLEQETDLSPTEIMSDTAGYTDAIFGIFYLLGYQFSPRIADVEQRQVLARRSTRRLWRPRRAGGEKGQRAADSRALG